MNVSLYVCAPIQFAFDTTEGQLVPAGTLIVLVLESEAPIVTTTVPPESKEIFMMRAAVHARTRTHAYMHAG